MAQAKSPIPEGFHTRDPASDLRQRRAGDRVVQEGARRRGEIARARA